MCRDFRKVVTNILGDVKWKPPSFDAENLDIWNYTVLFTKVVLASSEKIQKKKRHSFYMNKNFFHEKYKNQ